MSRKSKFPRHMELMDTIFEIEALPFEAVHLNTPSSTAQDGLMTDDEIQDLIERLTRCIGTIIDFRERLRDSMGRSKKGPTIKLRPDFLIPTIVLINTAK